MNPSPAPDMGKVYDNFAEKFAEADKLPSWRYVGKPAMERLLSPHMQPGVKFLDLGSASGRVEVGVLLPGGVKPGDITGVEISPEQVAMAKERIPGAKFVVGDISSPNLPEMLGDTFDVVFSHMVFEHVSDEQFAQVCDNVRRLLKPAGIFAFVVTHPDKMTDLNDNLVTHYGAFKTTAPWGGVLDNWRRSVEDTKSLVRKAGFNIGLVEELSFPTEPPANLNSEDLAAFEKSSANYRRYPAIRLALKATRLG
jgi:SAM-dependent methyltransferase